MGADMPKVGPALIAGRYQLQALIGRGGMAEVWRGHDHRLDTAVAVKILDPLVGDIAAAERFAREARAAAQIVHPNAVTVLDVGQDGNRRFLVMELLTGRSLADELAARGRLPVAEACVLLAQAAAGLAAAHQVGVVHRDIKPANLHLSGNGTLKVVDFGLAHIAAEAARLTRVGTIVGTAAYLAPEQIDGSGGQAACDLYGLGCVAYELLCGQPPFTGSAPELVYQHVHRSPARPSSHRPDIPVELERLILAMLAKNPADRPRSAEQVRQILAALPSAHALGRHTGHPTPTATAPPIAPAVTTIAPIAPVGRSTPTTAVPPPHVARAGDTALLDAPPPGPAAAPPQGRHLLVQLAVALGAIMIVALGVVAYSGPAGQAAAPIPSAATASVSERRQPTPSVTATETTKPTAQPTPTPASTPSRPAARDPRTWLSALDRAVSAQQGSGGIDPKLADKAHQKIREAAEKLAEGNTREAQKKIQELARDLSKARRKGKLAEGPLTVFLNRFGLSRAEDDRAHDD